MNIDITQITLIALIGYFIGSVPTAYLVMKYKRGIDITNYGSGNVGTLNSYEVSNSKKIGIAVLLIDLLKGIFSVFLIRFLFDTNFIMDIISLNAAVLGHCYSIWLKFKGGRGLATAAGGLFVISPIIPIIWLVTWYITHKWKKIIHLANILATMVVIISSIIFVDSLNNFSMVSSDSNFIFSFSVSLLMLIILTKHISPLKEILKNK